MRAIVLFCLASILLFSGCTLFPDGIVCTLVYVYGINGSVTDADTGEPIDGATLTLKDGFYQEQMQSSQNGGFAGAGERAGTYSLTAVAPGYQTKKIDDIVVTADQCHVHGVNVDVELEPVP